MKKIIAAVLLCASSLTFAGDVAKLTHLGFSADGKFYAFMQSGVNDGLGNAYAEVRFLDVAKNSFAAPGVDRFETEDDMSDGQSRGQAALEAEALKASEASLKALKISKNNGQVVLSRKLEDLDARKLKEANFSIFPIIPGLGSSTFKMNLKVIKAQSQQTCLGDAADARKLKLELVNSQTNKVKVLQEDKVIPKSRGCALNYEIEDIIATPDSYGMGGTTSVVALIRVFSDGFEGNNVRYIAISGLLD